LLAPHVWKSAAWPSVESIVYYSVSLVQPRTRKLVPIKVYYNGQFMTDRTLTIRHGSTFYVKVRAPRGRYLSVIFRDDSSHIYDLPLKARRLTEDQKELTWTMPGRFVPGDVEFFLCLWAGVNPDTLFMEGAIEKTGWLRLGRTTL